MALHKRERVSGFLSEPLGIKINDFMILDEKVHKIHKVTVHQFSISDTDDPEIYAAVPIMEWQQSEKGAWVMERSVEVPMWHRQHNSMNWGLDFPITAYLKDTDYTFYQLKWGQNI
jgi:hypothetical protein